MWKVTLGFGMGEGHPLLYGLGGFTLLFIPPTTSPPRPLESSIPRRGAESLKWLPLLQIYLPLVKYPQALLLASAAGMSLGDGRSNTDTDGARILGGLPAVRSKAQRAKSVY